MKGIVIALLAVAAMCQVSDYRDYVNLVSPIATCNILENNRDIYGSLSILQDSIYTSVVTIRLANIEPGQYALVVHEDPIDGNDCGSAHDRYHFGRDQFEITSQFSVSPEEDAAIETSYANIITESDAIRLYGNNTLIEKSFVLHEVNDEFEIQNDRIACCTVRFL